MARPPNVLGGALVVPASWFANVAQAAALRETPPPYGAPDREIERLAMEKVMQFEREQGFEPRDISAENRGYDIESRDPKTDRLRFIEVKGRVKDAITVTITRIDASGAAGTPWRSALATSSLVRRVASSGIRPPYRWSVTSSTRRRASHAAFDPSSERIQLGATIASKARPERAGRPPGPYPGSADP